LEVEKPSDSFIGETGSFGPVETAGVRKKIENLAEHFKNVEHSNYSHGGTLLS
jgi:hypothetical protein